MDAGTRGRGRTPAGGDQDAAPLSAEARALKQTRARLRAMDVRLQAILASAGHGVSLYDRHQRLVYCNQTFLDIYRLPAALGRKGTTYRAILEARVKANTHIGDDPIAYVDRRVKKARIAQVAGGIQRLNSGQMVSLTHLPIADGGWVSTHKDVTETVNMHTELSRLAYHDPLTGLANRTQFYRKLESALSDLGSGKGFAVLCLDLDGFKPVNDAFGHATGDMLLKGFADRLRRLAGTAGCVARMGGDEFTVLLPATEAADASEVARQIVAGMQAPFDVDGRSLGLSVGIGIALAPQHGGTGDELLGAADLALYAAKRQQRGGVTVYDAALANGQGGDRAMEDALRRALELGEFEIHYQPIVNLAEARIAGFEALLRWRHPERGLVAPGEFIPVAERSGLIVAIGEWVMREALREAGQWPDGLRLAVNVSPVQLRQKDMPAKVLNALASSSFAPDRLEVEITESDLLGDAESGVDMLGALRSLGVRVVLDDLGAGYSALGHLLGFQFDKLKIDRNFVAALDTSPKALTILRAVAAMARELGVESTAEGIETIEQLRAVHEAGFSEGQGFLMARPLTREAVRGMLAAFDRMEEAPLGPMRASG